MGELKWLSLERRYVVTVEYQYGGGDFVLPVIRPREVPGQKDTYSMTTVELNRIERIDHASRDVRDFGYCIPQPKVSKMVYKFNTTCFTTRAPSKDGLDLPNARFFCEDRRHSEEPFRWHEIPTQDYQKLLSQHQRHPEIISRVSESECAELVFRWVAGIKK